MGSKLRHKGAAPRIPKKVTPVYDFARTTMTLHRVSKEVEEDVLTFKTDPKMTKPEIKQYLEKIYGLNVERLNTLVRMGKIKYDTQKVMSKLIS